MNPVSLLPHLVKLTLASEVYSQLEHWLSFSDFEPFLNSL
jgi:hypothetical protein